MDIVTTYRTINADLTSPVAVYLRLRDKYPNTFLLESSDSHGADNCRSFIGCDPIAEFKVDDGEKTVTLGRSTTRSPLAPERDALSGALSEFLDSFTVESPAELPKGVSNGAFGALSWNSLEYIEKIRLTKDGTSGLTMPAAHFFVFRYVLAFNPFRNEVHVLINSSQDQELSDPESFLRHAFDAPVKTYPFTAVGGEQSVVSDEDFLSIVRRCKQHIARGDVFQIVPSRRYKQPFEGDEFQVYRALRSINPSPYLFYCDFGDFKIFGSSPEAQIVVKDRQASIFPIAGTYPRTGNDALDRDRAEALLEDPKENAEHCMLVDLARNDLSRHCSNVFVKTYREVQYFSHVIHLVSEVTGTMRTGASASQVVADSFPAGTLSGAPKHRAMQLLNEYEPHRREFYGGCVGVLGFNGDAVLGIVIRSFMSHQNVLHYQAGMGVVHDSIPESELAEAHHKLGAPRAAIRKAIEMK